MTLYEYNQLEESAQLEALCEYGEKVGDRMDREHKIILYQVSAFYVELFYHLGYDILSKTKSFWDTECLDPYVKNFDLKELNSLIRS